MTGGQIRLGCSVFLAIITGIGRGVFLVEKLMAGGSALGWDDYKYKSRNTEMTQWGRFPQISTEQKK